MRRMSSDVLVIGAGPAGLAAAHQARQHGASHVVVLERHRELGGILPQCIHNGFGVRVFGSDLTGPEYAGRWIRQAREAEVEFLTGTMVLEIDQRLRVVATSGQYGLIEVHPKALVLAMGCRERSRGALAIPGTRPSGVYTAGTAQRMVNMEGYMPGERVVILGSGDIGMIMARRLTIEGARVMAMLEILPYVSGLRRNLVQCIRDFDIPLQLCTTVAEVKGRERLQAVVTSRVDEKWRPIAGSERMIPCDTLLLSVGLIPENELSRMSGVAIDPSTGGPFVDGRNATSPAGVFAAGNVVHVYDLVDDVTESALRAGRYAAEYACRGRPQLSRAVQLEAGDNVHHVVPQRLHLETLQNDDLPVQFRVRRPIEESVRLQIVQGEQVIVSKRERYVRPSEMLTLKLTAKEAGRIAGAEALTVRVVHPL